MVAKLFQYQETPDYIVRLYGKFINVLEGFIWQNSHPSLNRKI